MVPPFLLDLVVWPWRAMSLNISLHPLKPLAQTSLIHVVLVSLLPHSSVKRGKRKENRELSVIWAYGHE